MVLRENTILYSKSNINIITNHDLCETNREK
ncbi:hypothetical protein HNR33_003738 [Brassicibacter mesophilus]